MPQHEIFLSRAFFPSYFVWVSPAVGYQEFSRVDRFQEFDGLVSDALDSAVDAADVNFVPECPYNLEFRIVFEKMLCKSFRVAAVLLEIV